MRHTVLTFLLLVVVVAVVTACAPSESERIAALEATIEALEREEEVMLPTQEPYPTPTGQATTAPMPVQMQPSIIWTIQGNFLIGEDKVFTIDNVSGGVVVHCFDIATGQELWQWEQQWETTGMLLSADPDAVYVCRADGRYYALDSHSGREKWKVIVHPELGCPLRIGYDVEKEKLFQDADRLFLSFSDLFVAMNKGDGSVVWELPWPTFLTRTDRVLLMRDTESTLTSGTVAGIDPATGAAIWEVFSSGHGAIADDALFVTSTGAIMAFDINSGTKLWESAAEYLGEIREVSPSAVYAKVRHLTGSEVRVFDRQTGEERWSWYVAEYGGGFLGEVQGTAILSDDVSGFTWAVDPSTGNIRWENDDLVLDGVAGVSEGGTLLAWQCPFTGPCFLFGIDFASGERKWRRQPETYGCVSPSNFRGTFFYSTWGGDTLVFLDPETGEQVTTLPLPCDITLLVSPTTPTASEITPFPGLGEFHYGGYEPRGDLLLLYSKPCLLAIPSPST